MNRICIYIYLSRRNAFNNLSVFGDSLWPLPSILPAGFVFENPKAFIASCCRVYASILCIYIQYPVYMVVCLWACPSLSFVLVIRSFSLLWLLSCFLFHSPCYCCWCFVGFFFCFYSLVRLVSLFGSTTIFRLYEPLYVECGSSLCRASTILFLSHKHTSGGYTRTASNIQRNQCQYIKSRQTCRFHTHFVPSLGPMWFASVVWDGQTVLAKSFFSW